jgi:hypothetical protein
MNSNLKGLIVELCWFIIIIIININFCFFTHLNFLSRSPQCSLDLYRGVIRMSTHSWPVGCPLPEFHWKYWQFQGLYEPLFWSGYRLYNMVALLLFPNWCWKASSSLAWPLLSFSKSLTTIHPLLLKLARAIFCCIKPN